MVVFCFGVAFDFYSGIPLPCCPCCPSTSRKSHPKPSQVWRESPMGQPRRSNIKEFLDVHAVQDADEQEVLWVAVAALCSWNQE